MKRFSIVFLLLIVFSFLWCDPLFRFEPEVLDAVSISMGRASLLSTSYSNALFINPALLGDTQNFNMQGGFRMHTGAIVSDDADDETTRSYLPHFKANHLSAAVPFRFKAVPVRAALGIGYQTHYDFAYKYKEENIDSYYDDEYVITSKGGYNTLTLGGGVNYMNKILLGATCNIGIASKYEVEEEFNNSEYGCKAEVNGTFFNFGLIYKLQKNFSIGVKFRPAFKLDFDYDNTINPSYGHEEQLLPSRAEDREYEIPYLLALGFKYMTSDNTAFFFEFNTRNLGEYYQTDNTYDFNSAIYEDSENGFGIHFGGVTGKQFPLRFGLFVESVPIYNDTWDEDDNTPNMNVGFTGGMGFWQDKPFKVDVFGEFFFTSQTVEDDYWDDYYMKGFLKLGATLTYEMEGFLQF